MRGAFGSDIVKRAQDYIDEFQTANLKHSQVREEEQSRWPPLEPPWYEVNIDGTVFSSTKEAGVGIVARDHTSALIAALSKKISAPLGPLESEAKAF